MTHIVIISRCGADTHIIITDVALFGDLNFAARVVAILLTMPQLSG
jgi:hypothetical protein